MGREATGIAMMEASKGAMKISLKSFSDPHSPFSLFITQWQSLVINLYFPLLMDHSPADSPGPQSSSFPRIECLSEFEKFLDQNEFRIKCKMNWRGFQLRLPGLHCVTSKKPASEPTTRSLCTEHALMPPMRLLYAVNCSIVTVPSFCFCKNMILL